MHVASTAIGRMRMETGTCERRDRRCEALGFGHGKTLTLGCMEQAASEREALPDAPLADGKDGGKQEAEGMGAPFGLAL